MPELPEVEMKRRYVEKTSLNRVIELVRIVDGRILDSTSPASLKNGLKETSFVKTTRRGKYLLLATSADTTLLMHFGMNGDIAYSPCTEEQPKWTRVEFLFKGGSSLAYTNKRMLGKIALYKTTDQAAIPDIAKLGPEPLGRSMSYKVFHRIIEGHSTTIHQVLMQQDLIAGIGNIYSDEITFQAGVLPYRKTSELIEDEIRILFDKMKWVLKKAIDLDADLEGMGDRFIIPNRVKGGSCPRCHGPLMHKTIGGRTSYYCVICQK